MKTRIIIAISTLIFFVPFIIYFSFFNDGFSVSDDAWSNFGSFIGGIGATIFSFTSFILLLLSFNDQKRKDFEDSIETKFFKYIELLNNARGNLVCNFFGKEIIVGLDIISRFNGITAKIGKAYDDLQKQYSGNINNLVRHNQSIEGELLFFESLRDSIQGYINTLNSIIKFIEKIDYNKNDYKMLFLAQLSNQEKICLSIFLSNELIAIGWNTDLLETKFFEFNSSLIKKCELLSSEMDKAKRSG